MKLSLLPTIKSVSGMNIHFSTSTTFHYLLRKIILICGENIFSQMDPEVVIPVLDEAKMKVLKDIYTRRYAYVTFLAGDGDYVKGVVCLAKGLRKVRSAYPLVVAILPDVPEEHRNLLVNQGCLVREIEPVLPPVDNKESPFVTPYFAIRYSKLRLWGVSLLPIAIPSVF